MEKVKINKSTKALMGSAKILVWKHGIKRVTVEEICKEAGISKMTFYRYFESKMDIVKHLMHENVEQSLESYNVIMTLNVEYPEKVKQIIAFKRKQAGNMSMELLKDIYSEEEEFRELREFLNKYQSEFMSRLHTDFLEAQKCGYIREDMNINFIIYMLGAMDKLLSDPNLISMFGDLQSLTSELTSFLFYGIMNR